MNIDRSRKLNFDVPGKILYRIPPKVKVEIIVNIEFLNPKKFRKIINKPRKAFLEFVKIEKIIINTENNSRVLFIHLFVLKTFDWVKYKHSGRVATNQIAR